MDSHHSRLCSMGCLTFCFSLLLTPIKENLKEVQVKQEELQVKQEELQVKQEELRTEMREDIKKLHDLIVAQFQK